MIFLAVVDFVILSILLYACCSKINHRYDIDNDAEVYILLKNNKISHDEVDVESLYN